MAASKDFKFELDIGLKPLTITALRHFKFILNLYQNNLSSVMYMIKCNRPNVEINKGMQFQFRILFQMFGELTFYYLEKSL